MKQLPKDFYWGGSVSSFQTEGAWDEGGKGLSIYDVRPTPEGHADWKVAIDEYHRYKEDIQLMKQMGFNFYRFSIAWSRIIPNGDDEVNEEGVAFYNNLIDELIANGITPMITLVHFDMPYKLVKEYNGFASRKVVDLFERYARVCMQRFGDRVKHWMSFNEQNLHACSLIYSNAEKVPEGESKAKFLYQVAHNVMIAHCKAVKALRELVPDAKFGGMTTITQFYPETTSPQNNLFVRQISDLVNYWTAEVQATGKYPYYYENYLKNRGWMPTFEEGDEELLTYTCDYLCFSYYKSNVLSEGHLDMTTPYSDIMDQHVVKNKYLEATQWGWEKDAIGLRLVMNDMYERWHKPLFILENGMGAREELNSEGTVNDDYRIKYHREHIQAMKNAILEDGVACLGYITWGPIDIPSSSCQVAKRYGFVYVNRTDEDIKDLKRIPKKSFYWIAKAFKSNGEDLD
ncbi:beta-glucosidase [Intestinibaculum porci]|uniref:Beta-glucosidase n=1 Tax=Intestinibaculum porci TaxID=2487118 RepID=A0A3G9J915_9FIRM|nr:glycoside hydrolase family 1 protein [Intestinibaculum porci]BBH27032.1 beta-glucosidase [Intestinibaculum porci]